jgi:hypothetical protein
MVKTWSVCTAYKAYELKHAQYSSPTFKYALSLSTLGPKMLSPKCKQTQITLAGDQIIMADQDVDLLSKIITGDETW